MKNAPREISILVAAVACQTPVSRISSEVGVRLNDQFNPSLKAKAYLDRNRRAKPSVPRAAPSNIIVAPPSGTLLIDGGIGLGAAPALWLNASIRAQTAPETSTSLFERVFNFIAQ